MDVVSDQMQGVWSAVAAATGGAGAAVMFLGARRSDGVPEIARSFASLAASRAARSVWLLDLDFFSDGQFAALGGSKSQFSGPFDMTFGRMPFWRASPRAPDGSQGEGAVVGYRTRVDKLFVSRFDKSALRADQKLQVAPAPDYWRAVRANVDMTIVEAPPLELSRAGLALVADMDGVVLVIDAENGDVRDAIEMRDEILGRGGRCLGIVVSELSQKAAKRAPSKSMFSRGNRDVEEEVA
jgi:Mrp family chromosome partitioning ATPase